MTRKSSSPRKAGDARKRVARCVRRLRTERKLSQEQLAELAGFHRTYVSQLERCVANISIDGLERLAGSLSVDVAELLAKPTWSANDTESVAFGLRLPMP
ncbi:MAG TPA: helix-turn-helix transcriptional regulator [Pseudoxanthomonas sp.]